MTMTQKAAKIRIASGFMSALDKCRDCGDEHDVASQVECRACGYHAGSDLSQEWLGHVEEEMKTIPEGVELDFAHACPTTHGTITALSESLSCGDSGDSEIVVVTDAEEIIASDRATVDEYIRNWGPLDIYLRLRSEVG